MEDKIQKENNIQGESQEVVPQIGEVWVIQTPSTFPNSHRNFTSKITAFNGSDMWEVEKFQSMWFGRAWFLRKHQPEIEPSIKSIGNSSTNDSKIISKGAGTEYGYRIEARDTHVSHVRPAAIHDGILTGEWREIAPIISDNPAGVPSLDEYGDSGRKHNLMPYESAVALAWTLIAQNRWKSIECRLVKYKLETSYFLSREGIVENSIVKSVFLPDIKLEIPESKLEKPAS